MFNVGFDIQSDFISRDRYLYHVSSRDWLIDLSFISIIEFIPPILHLPLPLPFLTFYSITLCIVDDEIECE
jgi:hypothetical protein